MSKPAGRPNKFYTHVKPHLENGDIEKWCLTMTDKQIAKRMGVGYSSFMQYKIDFPELSEIMKKGREDLVAELKNSLIKRAHGYFYTEKKVIKESMKIPKDMLDILVDSGYSRKDLESCKIVREEETHKHMPCDVAAANLLLKNYDKENWANDPQMLEIRKKELELKEKQIENNSW